MVIVIRNQEVDRPQLLPNSRQTNTKPRAMHGSDWAGKGQYFHLIRQQLTKV